MLNIISRSIVEGGTNGPQKVVSNLIKGLDMLGYPYCVNKALDATSQLWIHDDLIALEEASKRNIKALIGPNLYILPRNIPKKIDMTNFIFLFPSKWSAEFWKDFGFDKCPQDLWPAGIDTNEYSPTTIQRDIVLIYFKQRYSDELSDIENILKTKKIKYEVIKYGSYIESDYKKKLSKSKYVIWLGRHETQGIALQQALSMNVPMIVCEVEKLGHWMPTKKEVEFFTEKENNYKNISVAPYFNDDCGIKIFNINEIYDAIVKMEKDYSKFSPRKFIIRNLNLEKQACDLLNLYDKYLNITYNEGKKEKIKNNKNWLNAKIHHIIYFKLKKIIKMILKKIRI